MHNLLSSIIFDIVQKDIPNPGCLPRVVEDGKDIVVDIATAVWIDPDYKCLNVSCRAFRINGFDAEERYIALRQVPEEYTRIYRGEEEYIRDSIKSREEFEALAYN